MKFWTEMTYANHRDPYRPYNAFTSYIYDLLGVRGAYTEEDDNIQGVCTILVEPTENDLKNLVNAVVLHMPEPPKIESPSYYYSSHAGFSWFPVEAGHIAVVGNHGAFASTGYTLSGSRVADDFEYTGTSTGYYAKQAAEISSKLRQYLVYVIDGELYGYDQHKSLLDMCQGCPKMLRQAIDGCKPPIHNCDRSREILSGKPFVKPPSRLFVPFKNCAHHEPFEARQLSNLQPMDPEEATEPIKNEEHIAACVEGRLARRKCGACILRGEKTKAVYRENNGNRVYMGREVVENQWTACEGENPVHCDGPVLKEMWEAYDPRPTFHQRLLYMLSEWPVGWEDFKVLSKKYHIDRVRWRDDPELRFGISGREEDGHFTIYQSRGANYVPNFHTVYEHQVEELIGKRDLDQLKEKAYYDRLTKPELTILDLAYNGSYHRSYRYSGGQVVMTLTSIFRQSDKVVLDYMDGRWYSSRLYLRTSDEHFIEDMKGSFLWSHMYHREFSSTLSKAAEAVDPDICNASLRLADYGREAESMKDFRKLLDKYRKDGCSSIVEKALPIIQ